MFRMILVLIFSIGLIQAQPKVTQSITMIDDDPPGRKIQIETSTSDSTLRIIVEKDGEIEEEILPLNSLSDDIINRKLAEFDIGLHGIHFKPFHGQAICNEKEAWLGVQIQPLSEQLQKYFGVKQKGGVLVAEVTEGSPAEKAGLKAGDIILKVDDSEISSTSLLKEIIRHNKPGTEITVRYIRGGKEKTQMVKLGEYDYGDNYSRYSFDPDIFRQTLPRIDRHLLPDPEQFKKFDFYALPNSDLRQEMD
ncbi:MAG: PDZ domain-containing protein, partial [Candidatus Neomarinimicrobiota bacterium]